MPVEKDVRMLTPRYMMWLRFRRHRVALMAAGVIAAFYLVVLTADFFAYSDPESPNAFRSFVPPQPIHLFDNGEFAPFVYGLTPGRDPVTLQRTYTVDAGRKIRVVPFGEGFDYKLLGLIETNRHLIGVSDASAEDVLFLMGTDVQGRDLWSRLMFGTRISLTVGLVGVVLSLTVGVILGAISGYFGGVLDDFVQRLIEVLRSIPTIPLWMGLTAAFPRDWDVVQSYFALTLVISLIGWTEVARVVRGRFLAIRMEDFVLAARVVGCDTPRIIFRHMVPAVTSYVIAATTLALPLMIISETSLSFLGLGLRPPATSWGVLLQEAQNVQAVALTPWLLLPAIPVTVVILAFNFLGDGLRDAADPYSRA